MISQYKQTQIALRKWDGIKNEAPRHIVQMLDYIQRCLLSTWDYWHHSRWNYPILVSISVSWLPKAWLSLPFYWIIIKSHVYIGSRLSCKVYRKVLGFTYVHSHMPSDYPSTVFKRFPHLVWTNNLSNFIRYCVIHKCYSFIYVCRSQTTVLPLEFSVETHHQMGATMRIFSW